MGWFKDFVKEVTGSSGKEVAEAHHQARDDSGVRSGDDKSHFDKAPDWAEPRGSSEVDYFPDGKGSKE